MSPCYTGGLCRQWAQHQAVQPIGGSTCRGDRILLGETDLSFCCCCWSFLLVFFFFVFFFSLVKIGFSFYPSPHPPLHLPRPSTPLPALPPTPPSQKRKKPQSFLPSSFRVVSHFLVKGMRMASQSSFLSSRCFS